MATGRGAGRLFPPQKAIPNATNARSALSLEIPHPRALTDLAFVAFGNSKIVQPTQGWPRPRGAARGPEFAAPFYLDFER